MSVLSLLREDLRDFAGYRSARAELAFADPGDGNQVRDIAWLNANESPWPNLADGLGALRRYPEPQPMALRDALAATLGCDPSHVLLGRGGDEAIDLLVRAFCTQGRDAVLVTPPVFGMYAVCARLQGARLLEAPLRDDGADFRLDLGEVGALAESGGVRLVFLCSPGNPAGGTLPVDAVLALAARLAGRALVVVDEAYVEYADTPSLLRAAPWPDNLAVLRTLSKAHALAGARVGCLVAAPEVVAALRRCQAPYPVAVSSAELALRALSPEARERTRANVAEVKRERERLRRAIAPLSCVRSVYGSQANFLLVRFVDPSAALAALSGAGIVVRDMRAMPQLSDALRITVGAAPQNDAVVRVLARLPAEVAA